MRTIHVAQVNTTTQVTDYPQWVTAESAGIDTEDAWNDYHTFKAALKGLESCGETDNGFDPMKRLSNGTLTMEF